MNIPKLGIAFGIIATQVGTLARRVTVSAVLQILMQPPLIVSDVRILPRHTAVIATKVPREERRRTGQCHHSCRNHQVSGHSVFHRRTPFTQTNTMHGAPFRKMNRINRAFTRA
jgi:hypothetical protein